MEVDGFAGEQAGDHPEGLVEAAAPPGKRHTRGSELRLPLATDPHAQNDTAGSQGVDAGDLLGRPGRVAQSEQQHAGAEPDARARPDTSTTALVTPRLARRITGADIWHIDADEALFLDDNTEFNPPRPTNPGPYRSSDHDPVLVGVAGQPGDVTRRLHASC